MQKLTLLSKEQPLVQIPPDQFISLTKTAIPGAADKAQRPLSPAHLNALLQCDPVTWPHPVIVTKTSEGLLLLGGYHRTKAAKRLGLPAISEENIVNNLVATGSHRILAIWILSGHRLPDELALYPLNCWILDLLGNNFSNVA